MNAKLAVITENTRKLLAFANALAAGDSPTRTQLGEPPIWRPRKTAANAPEAAKLDLRRYWDSLDHRSPPTAFLGASDAKPRKARLARRTASVET